MGLHGTTLRLYCINHNQDYMYKQRLIIKYKIEKIPDD